MKKLLLLLALVLAALLGGLGWRWFCPPPPAHLTAAIPIIHRHGPELPKHVYAVPRPVQPHSAPVHR